MFWCLRACSRSARIRIRIHGWRCSTRHPTRSPTPRSWHRLPGAAAGVTGRAIEPPRSDARPRRLQLWESSARCVARRPRHAEPGDRRLTYIRDRGKRPGDRALSTASAARVALSGSLRRNAPDPVSLLLLGQLAVPRGIAPPVATGRRGSYPDRTGRPGCTRSDRWWRATPKQRERER
jgi:hypothetical protein